jgi:ABC-type multidrug transport system ATPase subunit
MSESPKSSKKQKSVTLAIDTEAPPSERSDFSDDLVQGFRREASTPRLGSALHRSHERPRYLRGLTMRSKLRQGFTNRFFRSRSDQLEDEADDSQYKLQVKESVTKEFMLDDEGGAMETGDDTIHKMVHEIHSERQFAEVSQKLRELRSIVSPYWPPGSEENPLRPYPLEVRIQSATYEYIEKERDHTKISTVYNTSCLYSLTRSLGRASKCQPHTKKNKIKRPILKDINLVIQPGKQYLVLGPPGSGKSSLLKMIAGLMPVNKHHSLDGSITYNGRSLLDQMKGVYIENAFGYVDQLDKHAALLTVGETLDFAFQCQAGGKFIRERERLSPEQIENLDRADRDQVGLQVPLCILGLKEVKDTFVGDANTRGVSGGQRRRVTVGEMIMSRVPVLCGDEISTGLDAASTYDMVEMLLQIGRRQHFSRVFSLLQPAPELVSLFDEVIVLAEGHIIFSGPIERVENYFAELGFVSPHFCDVADFLQLVSTEDRDDLYNGREAGGKAPSVEELASIFLESEDGQRIQGLLMSPQEYGIDSHGSVVQGEGIFRLEALQSKYANKWYRSVYLISRRFLTLWIRDRKVLLFSVIRNVINGASVGGAFLNADDFISIQGALFQTGIFILLGSLQSVSGLVEDRTLYYKHKAANFYSAWPYVIGRAISQIPQVSTLASLSLHSNNTLSNEFS